MACLHHALDAPRSAAQHVADLVRPGRRQGEEATGPAMIEGIGIDAIQGERVEVQVQHQSVAIPSRRVSRFITPSTRTSGSRWKYSLRHIVATAL